jgi:hypothetical protein
MRKKIWLGIGLAVVSGTLATEHVTPIAPALAEAADLKSKTPVDRPTVRSIVIADASAGGEGGEGGEAGEAGDVVDLEKQLARDLTLIRGHYRVGDELVALGKWEDALPHFHHPSEEIYGGLSAALSAYDVAPFLAPMKALAQTIQAKSPEAFATARQIMAKVLDDAEAKLKAKAGTRWVAVAMESAVGALKVAGAEYQASLDKKDETIIKNPVEYQDARGFVWQAEAIVDALAADPALAGNPAVAKIKNHLSELKPAWPDVMPPAKTAVSRISVLGHIATIELSASKLIR